MATTLTVTLSAALQATLSNTTNGEADIWAVYFTDEGSTAHAVKLDTQAGTPAGPTTIDLPTPYNGGKVYFLIQSTDPSAAGSPAPLTFGPGGTITKESDISWTGAQTNQYRYDSFEVSLLGKAADAGNLTDVNAFGIPMSVDIQYGNGAPEQTRGYAVNGTSIYDQIATAFPDNGGLIDDYDYGPLAGTPRLAAAPSTAIVTSGLGGASAANWYAYVEAVGNKLGSDVQIAGQYNGAATVEYVLGQTNQSYFNWHNAGFYSYTLTYDKAPWTEYSGSQTLAANPFQTQTGSNSVTVYDPNAASYTIGTTQVTIAGAQNVGGIPSGDINGAHTVTNIIDATHYVFSTNKPTVATSSTTGGGSAVTSLIALGSNPFSANAGDSFITVTDPTASAYANTGVQVTFTGATGFAGFSDSYLDTTTFTITKVIDATHYEVATTTAASSGIGGGSVVAPTYVRPDAGTYVFTANANSQVKGTIEISSHDLANSIYSTLGTAQIIGPNGTPYQFSQLDSTLTGVATTSLNTGFNTQWGAMFVKLLTGFIGGYYGASGTVSNPWAGGPNSIDLSQNWNFDPSYAFGANLASAFSWNTDQYGNGVGYDPYAKIFFTDTNSYGNGYSDAVMSLFQEGGPLVPTGYPLKLGDNPFSTTSGNNTVTVTDANAANYHVGDLVTFAGAATVGGIDMNAAPLIAGTGVNAFQIDTIVDSSHYTVKAATNATGTVSAGGGNAVVAGLNVSNINITLFDDNESAAGGSTLAQTQGYQPTQIFNTSAGPFVASGTSGNLTLQFGLGTGQMRPRDDLTVKLGFYSGESGGTAQFTYLTFDKTQSLFQQWQYVGGALVAKGNAAPTGSNMSISDLPFATGENWYQLVFSDPVSGVSRTYNIYLDGQTGQGIFNPNYVGADQLGSVAIDNLASFTNGDTTSQYLTTVGFNMFSGGTLSMDPSLLEQITDPTVMANNPGVWIAPSLPVLGSDSGDPSDPTFTGWGASGNQPNGNLGDVTQGSLAFGWYGADQSSLGQAVGAHLATSVNGYTNKIAGLDTAQISFLSGDGLAWHDPITATANVDGEWVTANADFGNGTYQAVLTEFDADGTTQLNNPSAPLSFTVDVPNAPAATNGHDLTVSGGQASWISLQATGSSLFNSTLLAYATDTSGNMLDRNGDVTTNIADAVLARVGAVAFDGGSSMAQGSQSVYLPAGDQLHFAIETGDGQIQQLPNTQVTGSSGNLDVDISNAQGNLSLTASVNNTLSADATLAGAQRDLDLPLVYLQNGTTVQTEIQGSSGTVNTIHFVKVDIDPTTGGLSVGGVAYGNTDAFRNAVKAAWDPPFSESGGHGNYDMTADWTVASGSGFYTPVMQTQFGNTFLFGNANADGMNHVRMFGQNLFGFEDLSANQGSDWDYNDMVVKLTPSHM